MGEGKNRHDDTDPDLLYFLGTSYLLESRKPFKEDYDKKETKNDKNEDKKDKNEKDSNIIFFEEDK